MFILHTIYTYTGNVGNSAIFFVKSIVIQVTGRPVSPCDFNADDDILCTHIRYAYLYNIINIADNIFYFFVAPALSNPRHGAAAIVLSAAALVIYNLLGVVSARIYVVAVAAVVLHHSPYILTTFSGGNHFFF